MRRLLPLRSVCALTLLALAAACDSPAVPQLDEQPETTASSVAGHIAFLDECAGCHASGDGFDLAFFSFPDSTIIRRALGHVDMTTSLDIVAYIRTLSVYPVGRFDQSFQPGGLQLDDDLSFAMDLFGEDAWPSSLAAEQLAAIDPTEVPVALAFPRWSFEETNIDWMPDEPLPDGILDYDGGLARGALAAYYATGTDAWLIQIVGVLRSVDRREANADAPCLTEDLERFRPEECFEVRRWTSSLVAQHMLRSGRSDPMDPILHDSWWDVGNAARKSLQRGATPIENVDENWAVWMYMGWAFSPERHASVYLGNGLSRLGLPRHATFVALRAQLVRRSEGSDPYADLRSVARFAPMHWLIEASSFGYRHLIDRLESGDSPDSTLFRQPREGGPTSHLDRAHTELRQAGALLAGRLSTEQIAQLTPLHERVLELLPEA